MNTLHLHRGDPHVLLTHLALYGLAAILDDAGLDDVRLGWTDNPQPHPWISATHLDRHLLGATVREHAAGHATNSWVQQNITLRGSARGLMSPRLTTMDNHDTWQELHTQRHAVFDTLLTDHAWADLTCLAALGEPCYWSHNRQGQLLQDDAAHRMEMQPRNQGSEFVGTRLRKLADHVAARDPAVITDGIDGTHPIDEAGNDKLDSRTATGTAPPGPTDNALAWCGLWGIGQLPSAPRINAPLRCSATIRAGRYEWFAVPVWSHPWRPARLRSILASRALTTAAITGITTRPATDITDIRNAHTWLAARHIKGIMRFPVHRFGSDNAPERRAMRATPVPITP